MTENHHRYTPIAYMKNSTLSTELPFDKYELPRFRTESELEDLFIDILAAQGYIYAKDIKTEKALIANLRIQIERLNKIKFTDDDWQRFFREVIAKSNATTTDKTELIQRNEKHSFRLAGEQSARNIMLINKKDICENILQVINQYCARGDKERGILAGRYDVTILVNGLPLVQIELKKASEELQTAFGQIERYKHESFNSEHRLFEYVQLFVISNGTQTKYYSNSVKNEAVKELSVGTNKPKDLGSFAFTNWWTDLDNNRIENLVAFAKTFLQTRNLLRILTRYCVFNAQNKLLVMRPYQIAATEGILHKIEWATNNKIFRNPTYDHKNKDEIKPGSGGYIWHTTGSGKTLTSFKTAQLIITTLDIDIKKVFFVVDRRDLDYQTVREFQAFQEGSVNAIRSTRELARQIDDASRKLIVTTIHKLSIFVKKNKDHPILKEHVVIIFDECHRSQFSEMHNLIIKNFKKYNIFGFTGTPILEANARRTTNLTTENVFGGQLHRYTILDAIKDKNVLPFSIEYYDTVIKNDNDDVLEVSEEDLLVNKRVSKIVSYILNNFDAKTARNINIKDTDGKRKNGFNSMFATASIEAAKRYYQEFKRQQQDIADHKRLKIALIYSVEANEVQKNGVLADDDLDNHSWESLDTTSRNFLADALHDYKEMFGVKYEINNEGLNSYYHDLAKKVRERELDILIVVNMFLTGFDAKTLNTLWVDKNLKHHNLIQAFSRTNRILNEVKKFGNIICFRNLRKETDDALRMFGDPNASTIVLIAPFAKFYQDYQNKRDELLDKFPLDKIDSLNEEQITDFVKVYGEFLSLTNKIEQFAQFKDIDAKDKIDKDVDLAYKARYSELSRAQADDNIDNNERPKEKLYFQLELLQHIEVNVDYILSLIHRAVVNPSDRAKILDEARKLVKIGRNLPVIEDLVADFIEQTFVDNKTINPEELPEDNIKQEFSKFVEQAKIRDLDTTIAAEKLNHQPTYDFMDNAFKQKKIQEYGTAIDKILPPLPFFVRNNTDNIPRHLKATQVLDKLKAFFEKYERFYVSE